MTETTLDAFETYEDYLDSKLSKVEKFYLSDQSLARLLIEIGTKAPVISREDFAAQVSSAKQAKRILELQKKDIKTEGKDYSVDPLMSAIASREKALVSGHMVSVLYLLCRNGKHEVSGYIDVLEWLGRPESQDVIEGSSAVFPSPKDLSYYNWSTNSQSSVKSSKCFDVLADLQNGLSVISKGNRSTIRLTETHSAVTPNVLITEVPPAGHFQKAVFYDLTFDN